jgi:hypothetical protein
MLCCAANHVKVLVAGKSKVKAGPELSPPRFRLWLRLCAFITTLSNHVRYSNRMIRRRRTITASNAVVTAAEQTCAYYGVRYYRMNSRTFKVVGAEGRERPMFMGQWQDRTGTIYRKGMADLLCTPRIHLGPHGEYPATVALWCECKSGSGRLTPEQVLFRDDVLDAGAYYLQLNDGPDDLLRWFAQMGVKRQ